MDLEQKRPVLSDRGDLEKAVKELDLSEGQEQILSHANQIRGAEGNAVLVQILSQLYVSQSIRKLAESSGRAAKALNILTFALVVVTAVGVWLRFHH